MRFFRRLDPFAARDPEEMELMMNRVPRKLVSGLATGAAMLVIAGLLTLGIAAALQKHAQDKSMRLTAERNAQIGADARTGTVPPQSGTMPDGRDVVAPAGPRPMPSPGPNPTPAEPR